MPLNFVLPDPNGVQVILTLCTLAALWLSWVKIVGPILGRGWNWIADLFTVFRGRKERIDRVTGEKLKPVPSLVEALVQIRDKQDDQGKSIENLTTVLTQVADQQLTLSEHTRQIADLRLGQAIHTEQIGLLKSGVFEKAALHQENAAFFDLVAKRDQDVIDPQEEP